MLRFHQHRNRLAQLTVVENAVSERGGLTMLYLLHVADSHLVWSQGYEIGDYLLRPNVLQEFYVRPTTPTLGTA
jgi:hypothetical protein